MKTSEVRQLAFRIAMQMYESAGGTLKYRDFMVSDFVSVIGIDAQEKINSIEDYLLGSRIMEYTGVGASSLWFTDFGISIIEASLDKPDQSHGPFPPFNIVVGNVASGAQLAIGSGSFNQLQQAPRDLGEIGELVRIVQAAMQDWTESDRRQAAGAKAALVCEANAIKPDDTLIRPALVKIGKIAEGVTGSVASQALLAYLKSHGFMP
jgi:hypothetical protein